MYRSLGSTPRPTHGRQSPVDARRSAQRQGQAPLPLGGGRSRTPTCMRYHDEEWGRPVHDDRRLFEMLTLEGAQAGCPGRPSCTSAPATARAFAGFDPRKVARFDARRRAALRRDAGHRAQPPEDRVHREQRPGLPRRAARIRLLRPLPVVVRRRAARSSTARAAGACRRARALSDRVSRRPGRGAASASSAAPSSTPTCRRSGW